jgi:predicted nuclease of predicted toxin-antitoxin system
MKLLVDENVPNSVTQFFIERGHEVILVGVALPSGSPDPLVAAVGDRHSAIVVSWDKDFANLVKRVAHGSRTKFRKLGRISFRCKENNGRARIAEWIEEIERHYEKCRGRTDLRMIAELNEIGIRLF